MKANRIIPNQQLNIVTCLSLVAAVIMLATASPVAASSGTWTNKSNGSWANSVNWNGGTIADGTGNTADFSTLSLANDVTVNLDGGRTIGNLSFDDHSGAHYNWTLAPGSGGPLTLAVGSGSPTVTVGSDAATISVSLAGNNGLTKAGTGTLALSGDNAFTGNVTINTGALWIKHSNALGTGSKIVSCYNGTLGHSQLHLDGTGGNLTLASGISFFTSNTTDPGTVYNEGGDNIINGNVTMTSGGGSTIFLINAGSLTLNGSITANTSARNAVFEGPGSCTVNGRISDGGAWHTGVILQNNGVLTLTGSNSYTGSTEIRSGTLQAQANGGNTSGGVSYPLGSGTLTMADGSTLQLRSDGSATFNSGTVTANGTANLNVGPQSSGVTSQTLTFASNGLIITNGTLDVTGTNGYKLALGTIYTAGPVGLVSTGTEVQPAGANLGGGEGGLHTEGIYPAEFTGASYGNPSEIEWNFSDGAANIVGTGPVIKSGSGTMVLGGTNNSYSDSTTVSNGTLRLKGNNTTVPGPTFVSTGATLQLQATANNTVGGVCAAHGSNTVTLADGATLGLLADTNVTFNSGTVTANGTVTVSTGSVTPGQTNCTAAFAPLGMICSNTTVTFGGDNRVKAGGSIVMYGPLKIVAGNHPELGGVSCLGVYPAEFSGSGLTDVGDMSGQLSVLQSGAGTLALHGNNSYTGPTTVSNGTLQAQANGGNTVGGVCHALGSNTLTMAVGTTLELRSDGSVTFAGGGQPAINGGTVNVNVGPQSSGVTSQMLTFASNGLNVSSGTLNVTGTNGYKVGMGTIYTAGPVKLSSTGTEVQPAGANLGGAEGGMHTEGVYPVEFSGNSYGNPSEIEWNFSGESANIVGSGPVTKSGNGTMVLGGTNNSYSDSTTVSNGTLRLKGNNTAVTGPTFVSAGATLQLEATVNNTVGGVCSAHGSNTVTLADGATLQLRGNTNATFNSGTVTAQGTVNVNVEPQTSGVTSQMLTFASNGLNVSSGTLNVTGTNGYKVGMGTIYTAGPVKLSSTGTEVQPAGANLGGGEGGLHTEGVYPADFNGSSYGYPSEIEWNFGGESANIVGSGPVIKSGNGTMVLGGANNSYSDSTTVSNGTLRVNGVIANSPVTVVSGATLSGTGTLNAGVTVNGTLAPGNSVGTLTISNNLVLNATAVLNYELGASSDRTVVKGNLTLDGSVNVTDSGGFGVGDYTLITYTGALTDNGLVVGTTPNPSLEYSVLAGSGLVRLHVTTSGPPPGSYDAWASAYGLTNGCPKCGPGADYDGDGISNTNEFLAGFSPTNSRAYLHVISVTKSGNDMQVTYLGASGDSTYSGGPESRTNVLEYSTGTANGGYTTNFVGTGQTSILNGGIGGGMITNMVEVGGATNRPTRYYRVRVLAP